MGKKFDDPFYQRAYEQTSEFLKNASLSPDSIAYAIVSMIEGLEKLNKGQLERY